MAQNLEETYRERLKDKKIPLLVLDNKWHQLFMVEKKSKAVRKYEQEVNQLLQRQGKLGTDIKAMKKMKSQMLLEIQEHMEEAETDARVQKQQEKKQKMILEINEKTTAYEDELLDLPYKLEAANRQLMLETIRIFYEKMKQNEQEMDDIVNWIQGIRDKVKENLVKKTTLEEYNMTIYGYLHDVLGGDIVDVFDLKYLKKKEEEQE